MSSAGKPGSFSAYIKAGRDTSSSGRRVAPATPVDLLKLLPKDLSPMPLELLQTMCELPPSVFSAHVKELQGSGFVAVTGPTLDATIALTQAGKNIIGLVS
jgi:hypothetical protein